MIYRLIHRKQRKQRSGLSEKTYFRFMQIFENSVDNSKLNFPFLCFSVILIYTHKLCSSSLLKLLSDWFCRYLSDLCRWILDHVTNSCVGLLCYPTVECVTILWLSKSSDLHRDKARFHSSTNDSFDLRSLDSWSCWRWHLLLERKVITLSLSHLVGPFCSCLNKTIVSVVFCRRHQCVLFRPFQSKMHEKQNLSQKSQVRSVFQFSEQLGRSSWERKVSPLESDFMKFKQKISRNMGKYSATNYQASKLSVYPILPTLQSYFDRIPSIQNDWTFHL